MANEIAVLQRDITDTVSKKILELEESGLQLPPNYNAQNALKSAFFKIKEVKDSNKKPALEVCTKESIANTLLDMVTQGLSPAKTQCYFIVYGKQLQLNRSYFGTQAVLKRLNGVKDIWANVIYKDDEFDYSVTDGRERLVKHETKFQNRDNEILGAYAVVKTDDDEILTVMTKKEIEASWSQAKTKNVQNKFPQEMAKRTVINRAAKAYINTSDDSDLLVEAINNTTENEYENGRREVDPIEDVQDEIENEANQTVVDFDKPTEPNQDKPRKTAEPIKDAPTEEEQQSMFDNLNDLMPDKPDF